MGSAEDRQWIGNDPVPDMEHPSEWNCITATIASVWDPRSTDLGHADEVWEILVRKRLVRDNEKSHAVFIAAVAEEVKRLDDARPGPSVWLRLADRLRAARIVRLRGLRPSPTKWVRRYFRRW